MNPNTAKFIFTTKSKKGVDTGWYDTICKDRHVPFIEIVKGRKWAKLTWELRWLEISGATLTEIDGKVEHVLTPLGIQLSQLVERCSDSITASSIVGDGGFIDHVPNENAVRVAEELWGIFMAALSDEANKRK